LLNNQLNSSLKEQLEEAYSPTLIYDLRRAGTTLAVVYSGENADVYHREAPSEAIHPDLKILLATSGTTGSAKFVKLSDANFIANTRSILDYLPITPTDSCILNLPIHYSYGLSVLLTNIAAGGKVICSNETVLIRNFWDQFKRYACNSLAGVPYTYEMLVRAGFLKMDDLNLRYMTQAGGKISDKTLATFAAHCENKEIDFFVMYGQTEATARMAYLPPADLKQKPGSIGKAILDGSFQLDSDTSELLYAGPNVGNGYAERRADLTTCAPLALLHTGDLARMDAEGYYYIKGRMKRFVKLFGNRINLDELEQDLRKTFDCNLGCSGAEDKLLLVFSDNASLVAKEVQSYLSGKYQIHPSVIRYLHLDPLPLTASHKLNYQYISETYGR
jgi:long-chain acyl-CoA synthetase